MESFEQVYSEYYDIVYRYVLSLCRDESWAEEVTQEAFFKALKKIDSFRGDCKLSVWLCEIAKNTFYTQAKKKKRDVEFQPETISAEESMEQKIFDREDTIAIHARIHTLEEPYKEVFWMRTFGELSFKEISAIFGKTESWARVTYHRAKMKIKEGMK